MCNVCCREFAGWCKAFTRTERLLTILECFLLVVFIGFLTFLTLHLIVCPRNEPFFDSTDEESNYTTTEELPTTKKFTASEKFPASEKLPTTEILPDKVTTAATASTLDRNVKCTWKPSEKTKAPTLYYEYGLPPIPTDLTTRAEASDDAETDDPAAAAYDEAEDGEEAEEEVARLVTALVKIKPMGDVTFGCILTIVSEYWTLTAASCIEAVEEVDSLDAFVMAAGAGVAAVRLHPRYAGADARYDLAALRAAAPLASPAAPPLRLPTALDGALLALGERLTILGYGKFRSLEADSRARRVHRVPVYVLPGAACADADAGDGGERLRHLRRGAGAAAGACGGGGVCAGARGGRARPCGYCAGTPLLRGGTLLALMAGARRCGEACEPALYVDLAAHRDWIDDVVASAGPL